MHLGLLKTMTINSLESPTGHVQEGMLVSAGETESLEGMLRNK